MKSRNLIIFGALLVSACGGRPQIGGPASSVQPGPEAALPAPTDADMTQLTRSYLIGPFDKLSVEIFGVEELSREEVRVEGDGKLTYPLIGAVDAAGKTPAQLEGLMEDRLRGRFLRNPEVTVNLKETRTQVVTVEGQVKTPGLYPVFGKTSLMRAIATAHGLDQYGDPQHVVIFRTVGGQKMAALYNLKAIRRGANDDPDIYPNDVVVVGESQARKLFQDVLTAVSALSYPIITLIQK